MKKFLVIPFILLLLLTACGDKEEKEVKTSTVETTEKDRKSEEIKMIDNVVKNGNFTFSLQSEKNVYKKGEDVELSAFLAYDGKQESIELKHAQSPLSYELVDDLNNELLISNFPVEEANTATIFSGKPLLIEVQNIDMVNIESSKIRINAIIKFQFEGKTYEIKNSIKITKM